MKEDVAEVLGLSEEDVEEKLEEGALIAELAVLNEGNVHVLLLDGEELRGAKQNRMLNTSIMLSPKSKTILPVSCTEQGRWSYASREFSDSAMAGWSCRRRYHS